MLRKKSEKIYTKIVQKSFALILRDFKKILERFGYAEGRAFLAAGNPLTLFPELRPLRADFLRVEDGFLAFLLLAFV